MATIRKRGKSFQVQIRLNGVEESKTFTGKQEALDWSFMRELDIKNGRNRIFSNKKLSILLEEYAKNVTPRKKTAKNETNRVVRLGKSWLADMRLQDIDPHHIERWITEELQRKKPSSVLRDLSVLSGVFEYGRKKLRWIEVNPVRDADKPKHSPHRRRRISDDEIEQITTALGYDPHRQMQLVNEQMAVVFLLALETAMRQGELFSLEWANIDLKANTAYLPETKNGFPREVPLSTEAKRLIVSMRGLSEQTVFTAKQSSAEVMFRRAVKKLGIENLHFHDTRHEATTRLSKKYNNVLQLAAVTGHQDLRSLQVYYNPTASELAEMLD